MRTVEVPWVGQALDKLELDLESLQLLVFILGL